MDPLYIGAGVGAQLLSGVLDRASTRSFSEVVLNADPSAEPFYAHFGARTIGDAPSESIPGRRLPRMWFVLTGKHQP